MNIAPDTIILPLETVSSGATPQTLADVLAARGLDAATITVLRNTLHPDDMCSDFQTLEDVAQANALPMLDRMQDGPRIAHETLVLSFAATDGGRAKLTSFRRFLMRREGIVPGDIVYDYDAAHLLHSFIARATTPVFYDAFDEAGMDDLIGRLTVQWPAPLDHDIRDASDAAIICIAD